jgi:transketolase
MCHKAGASHIGPCLSEIEILVSLYFDILRVDPEKPDWPDRDRYIQSKGHACAALYACLARRGYFPLDRLREYAANGKGLTAHVDSQVPGVEVSTGSLGHGLSIAVGLAMAAKIDAKDWRTFVLLGDGECQEGSIWEAAMSAAAHDLDNLIAIVDMNEMQAMGKTEDVVGQQSLYDKFLAFGWSVCEVNGHDVAALTTALGSAPIENGKPNVILAHTVKGKGVSFMEGEILWHYRPPNKEELEIAISEIGLSARKDVEDA